MLKSHGQLVMNELTIQDGLSSIIADSELHIFRLANGRLMQSGIAPVSIEELLTVEIAASQMGTAQIDRRD
jgi:hypothetical protein